MATQATRNFRLAEGQGTVFYNAGIKEANSQSFVIGDLVTVTPGTGTVKVCVGAEGTQTNTIAGFALDAATNVTTGNIAPRIQRINSNETYIGNLFSGASGTASAITHLGGRYEIRKSSAGVWVIDVAAATTNLRVKVIGFVEGPDIDSSGNPYVKAIGDTAGEVYFKFLEDDGVDIDILDFGA